MVTLSSVVELATSQFGIFTPLHNYILSNARSLPAHFEFWPYYLFFSAPIHILFFLAWFLVDQKHDTRLIRAALGMLGVAVMFRSLSTWRFTDPYLDSLNNIFGLINVHVLFKIGEFALLSRPIVDPYMAKGRSRFVAAVDLMLNSRMLGLGSVGFDTANGIPNHKLAQAPAIAQADSKDAKLIESKSAIGDVKELNGHKKNAEGRNGKTVAVAPANGHANGKSAGKVVKHQKTPRFSSRSAAVFHHFSRAFTHYAVVDTLLCMVHDFGNVLVVPGGHKDAIATFVRTTHFTLWPGLLDLPVPTIVIWVLTGMAVPMAIYQGISLGYYIVGTICLGSGLWEVDSWDTDLFHEPLRAESFIDLWGKRWHQIFRHQFIVLTMITCGLLAIPVNSYTMFIITFWHSGLLHYWGEFTMTTPAHPNALLVFFVLSGVGCALEVAFKRFTGRRVSGVLGRLWMWGYMVVIGQISSKAWLDSGMAGSNMLPPHGLGYYLAPHILKGIKVTVDPL